MSMKKIAETAGVSVTTVSKAFHHSKDISEETRKQIFTIAKDLGVYEKYAGERYPKKSLRQFVLRFRVVFILSFYRR